MTKRCSRSGKKSKDELPAITLNPGALSQLKDYNRAPRRLFLRAKRARRLIATLNVLASLPLLCKTMSTSFAEEIGRFLTSLI